MEAFITLSFSAAHRLLCVPPTHKCGALHGHTYTVEIGVEGVVNPQTGWIMDFSEIKRFGQSVTGLLDHQYLNDISGLENPTSENIAKWLWRALRPQLPLLRSIKLQESAHSGVIYHGEEE